MGSEKNSQISHFILLGISKNPRLQSFLFVLFLAMYLVTMLGNLLIVLATISSFHLHTPMYFFLSNLSIVDACFASTTVPKMLVNINTKSNVITYKNCIAQMHFFILFSGLEIFLLTLMAYDWYVAICHPLHYTAIMRPQLCLLTVLASWIKNILHSIIQSLMTLQLTFCTDLEIPHFFCELNQVVQNACSDTLPNDVVIYFAAVLWACCPLMGILYSYSKIVSSLCAISSLQGKYKAFSTCASHLLVVSLVYCTGLGVYLSSASTKNSQSTARASDMYSVVTPMLNPFIYSLRNKHIKRALRKMLGWKKEKNPLLRC